MNDTDTKIVNSIETLREHLFATLSDLRDKEKPLDIDRAKAISDIAQVIVNSAKVEVEHIKVTGSQGSGFLEKSKELPPGITGITTHKIR
jgi:hypothetical protein